MAGAAGGGVGFVGDEQATVKSNADCRRLIADFRARTATETADGSEVPVFVRADNWQAPCLPFTMADPVTALKERTRKFAFDVLVFIRKEPRDDDWRSLRQQLIRSATSVGANYRAACRSRSRAEFIARIGVALEEADESAFWLELLVDLGATRSAGAQNLLREANELCAILAASSITAKANMERR